MPHKIEKLVLDIKLAIQEIELFIDGKSYEDFNGERLLQVAVEREFEIIGEALHRIQTIDKERLAVVVPEYRKIIGLRNVIAHGYDVIDNEALWDLAVNKLPDLKNAIENYFQA
ncbi:DUF86 domain-containing protein [Oscillatoria laete-virens NRMC-F 0139]|nr:HepT-like ribonuclease domain-containing protein [Oscillatoria laete-virens]MDL5054685.1 DUF86 domain-containing protein [Oscillatoria laete-virens NRMC-F 0139]